MKLYRIQHRTGRKVNETRFRTSQIDAMTCARSMGVGTIDVCKVEVPRTLSPADWIDLLETDAPGSQDINRTAVDFIFRVERFKLLEVTK